MKLKFNPLILLFVFTACQNDQKKKEAVEDYNLKIELEALNLQVDSIAMADTYIYRNKENLSKLQD